MYQLILFNHHNRYHTWLWLNIYKNFQFFYFWQHVCLTCRRSNIFYSSTMYYSMMPIVHQAFRLELLLVIKNGKNGKRSKQAVHFGFNSSPASNVSIRRHHLHLSYWTSWPQCSLYSNVSTCKFCSFILFSFEARCLWM